MRKTPCSFHMLVYQLQNDTFLKNYTTAAIHIIYLQRETEMEAIMSLSTLRLLTKGHCTLKMNSIQRFHIMTLIPYDLFALPIIISNSWDTQGPKKKKSILRETRPIINTSLRWVGGDKPRSNLIFSLE